MVQKNQNPIGLLKLELSIDGIMKILTLCILVLGMLSCNRFNEKRLNVIYISLEDMMPNMGCYGDSIAHTPCIDQFASKALLFEDIHCQVALCTPSRTSILTGIRPSTSGIVKIDDDWQKMLPNAVSLPRQFRDNGYFTAIAGKIHDYRCGGIDSAYDLELDIHGQSINDLPLQALDLVIKQKKPFFLAMGYQQTHDPWKPTDWGKSFYKIDQFSAEGRTPHYKGKDYDEDGIKALIRDYYAELTDVDSLVGEVLERIEAYGLFENSIVMVGAFDHGFNFGYRGHWGKGNCYDNETRVPILVHVPGAKANGRKTKALTELVDIYPTLIDLCHIPQPKQKLEGTSMQKLFDNPDLPWKKAVFNHRAYNVNIVGVKTSDYTLIDFAGDSVQLFKRKADPMNLQNIAGKEPDVVKQMMQIKQAGWEEAMPSVLIN